MQKWKNYTVKKKKRCGHAKRQQDRYRLVVLRLCGKNLDADKITEALGLEPDSAQSSANLRKENEKVVYNTPYGHWNLCSKLRRSATLQNQARDILARIKPKRKTLGLLLKELEADLNIAVEPHEDLVIAAYSFPAEIISGFTSLGIDIRFSVHIPRKGM
ncbi:MAG TPA: DUF4279 domain-containing protein [Sedimentisphaerales bacterium]|nr:DUF4279 domain-containing protein [Sedimentisphaerales bacterium]